MQKSFLLFLAGLSVGAFVTREFFPREVLIPAESRDVASESVEKPVAPTVAVRAEPVAAPQASAREESAELSEPTEDESVDTSAPRRVKKMPKVDRRLLEGLLGRDQIDRFVASVREENFFDVLRTMTPFRRVQGALADIEGRFVGEVSIPALHETWDMVMEGRFNADGPQIKGKTLVTLAKNGTIFSNSNGSGPLRDYFMIPGGVVVQASPTSYFQLYFLPRDGTLVGNYYEQTTPGQVIPKGVARLARD